MAEFVPVTAVLKNNKCTNGWLNIDHIVAYDNATVSVHFGNGVKYIHLVEESAVRLESVLAAHQATGSTAEL